MLHIGIKIIREHEIRFYTSSVIQTRGDRLDRRNQKCNVMEREVS